ncbi:MAG TPA: helix-turn-helix domain-containing protein [Acidimicrobiales bacterium]
MRPSNPTARVVAILDFLIAHPLDRFGLSELSRAVGVAKATCLSVLNTLVEAGWVLQHPTSRTYSLGAALASVTAALDQRFPEVARCRPALAALADDIDIQSVLVAAVEDQMVVLDSAGSPDPLAGVSRVGTRVPLAPPFGASLVAWSAPKAFDDWLARAVPPLDADEVASMRASLRLARRRGYVVTRGLASDDALRSSIDELRRSYESEVFPRRAEELSERMRRIGYFIDEIEPDETYHVNNIAAPVRHGGATALAFLVPGFGWKVTGRELVAAADRLLAATAAASEALAAR